MADLTHVQYDRLERAIVNSARISVYRRGTEFLVIPISLTTQMGREVIEARHPTTGERLTLLIDEIDSFEVIG